jgi:uracil permease
MATSDTYLYDLDQHPPFHLALVYGLQWTFIMFPGLIIAATLGVKALGLTGAEEVRFLQLTLLTSGLFTGVQTLWGHRYPLLEGPSTALVLSFILLAPEGLPAVQGGMMAGALLVILAVASGQLFRLIRFFTPNVVGVVLMLIALGLLRPLLFFLAGMEGPKSQGDSLVFLVSIGLVLFMATLSHRLPGFWKSVSLLLGMIAGSLVFLAMDRLDFGRLSDPGWISFIHPWITSRPTVRWAAVLAFACAYLAVMVNSLGSLQGVAKVTDGGRLESATRRGILINGLAGIACGLTGVIGTVSYSTGPGVVVVLRVASRYAVTYCGLILLLSAFLPKLAALLAMVPQPVVGAALCVALGAQMGVGISTVASRPLAPRDYFVVGIPLLLGTAVGFLPSSISDQLPGPLQVLVANSLIVGISLVLLLEHLLLREHRG